MTDSNDDNSSDSTPPRDHDDDTRRYASPSEFQTIDLEPEPTLTQEPRRREIDDTEEFTRSDVIDERYEVRGLLGSGSMGNVYRVHDRELDEVVALKTLHPSLVEDSSANRRFRREVKLARRVTHPNVARTYDLGTSSTTPFLTMEYIEGESLMDVIREKGPFNAEQFLAVVSPICRGLQAAHDAGVIHRDLKPQNVMVSEQRVVITDFGIARGVATSIDVSTTGSTMVGTPVYMAPEQVQNLDQIDERTDIYALGVMLYEMLTGKHPWESSQAVAIAFERIDRPAPSLPEEGSWPDVYRDLVHRCLQRNPDDRFDQVLEIVRHLEGTASDHRYSTFERSATNPASPLPGTVGRRRESLAERLDGGLDVDVPFDGQSVAVLPFEYSGPEEYEYLSVGLTEEVIDELSRTDGLGVLPLGTVDQFRDREIAPSEAGAELGVEVVVEGSVRRLGGSLRVRTAITSVAEGFQLWAERFETEPENLLEVGVEAADAVTEALTVDSQSTPYEAPSDPAVIDLYMRARHEMNERWFSELGPAIALYEKALDRAPRDPRLLSGIATARARAAFVDPANRLQHLREAEQLAERAIEVAPDWPEPHFALAKVHYNRVEFGRALAAVDRALESSADFAGAHALRGRIFAEIGPLDTARQHLERALDLNPYDYNARWDLTRVAALDSDWERVDELLSQPVESETHVVLRFSNRTRLDLWRDDPAWLDESPPELPEDSDFELLTPVMRRVAGGGALTEQDRQQLDVAIDDDAPNSRYLSLQHQFRAEIAARAGALDYALRSIEGAFESGLIDLNWLDFAPILDELRGRDRFEAVRAEVRDRVTDLLED